MGYLRSILSFGAVLAWSAGISMAAAQELNPQQILLIRDTASSICNTVRDARGVKNDLQLQGDIKGQLNGLVGKVIDIGGSGKGSISREDFEGLSRDATASALEGDRGCRERVFNKMFDKLGSAAAGRLTPLESITKTITDFGVALKTALGKHSDRPSSDSVGQLVIDLSILSGLELSLATLIEQLDRSPSDNRANVFVLNQVLDKVKDQYRVIQNDFAAIDKQWIVNNASLGIDIGNFAHDGALYYCFVSCRGEYYSHGPGIQVSADQAFVVGAQLQKDVASIQKLAADLQAASRK
jgi:hypothetical protein